MDNIEKIIFRDNAIIVQQPDGTRLRYILQGTESTTENMRLLQDMNIRSAPVVSSQTYLDTLPYNAVVEVFTEDIENDDYLWRVIASGPHQGAYIARYKKSAGKTYLEPTTSNPGDPPPSGTKTSPLSGTHQLKKYNGAYIIPSASGMGMNVRQLMYFGTSVMQYTSVSDIDTLLNSFLQHGVNHVRFYISHHEFDDIGWQKQRLHWLLQKMRDIGIKAIPVFMDSIAASGFTIASNLPWHNKSDLGHLNMEWYKTQQWSGQTLSRLIEISQVIAQYPDVVITFDLCNEPAIVLDAFNKTNADMFRECWRVLSGYAYVETLKRIPITIGVIDAFGCSMDGLSLEDRLRYFWGYLPDVHVVTNHRYHNPNNASDATDGENISFVESEVATQLGKAFAIGEWGVHKNLLDRRSQVMEHFFNNVILNRAMQWANWEGDFRPGTSDKGFTGEYAIAPFIADFGDMITVIQQANSIYFSPLKAL